MDSDPDTEIAFERFPLEPAPVPSPRGASGRMMRSKVLKALWQQFEAGKACHQHLDKLILLGRTGNTRPPTPTGARNR